MIDITDWERDRAYGLEPEAKWTRAPTLFEQSAKSPKSLICRSMCCVSGRRVFRRSNR
ncbi:protein of unknown function [Methylocella tundrae]|uniref:Uncharacterized protein n=1 Tax=Methylocella tundrae TaxID=227605 RepID=A0A4U8YXQ3_METTU|nr:protein of unknown function [Methylocella tundrae]